jgi:hypothetical protein
MTFYDFDITAERALDVLRPTARAYPHLNTIEDS